MRKQAACHNPAPHKLKQCRARSSTPRASQATKRDAWYTYSRYKGYNAAKVYRQSLSCFFSLNPNAPPQHARPTFCLLHEASPGTIIHTEIIIGTTSAQQHAHSWQVKHSAWHPLQRRSCGLAGRCVMWALLLCSSGVITQQQHPRDGHRRARVQQNPKVAHMSRNVTSDITICI